MSAEEVVYHGDLKSLYVSSPSSNTKAPEINKSFLMEYIQQVNYQGPKNKYTEANSVNNIDFLFAVNGTVHCTFKYQLMSEQPASLVIRRGKLFGILVSFLRAFNKETDHLTVNFTWSDMGKITHSKLYAVQCKCAPQFETLRTPKTWHCVIDRIKRDGSQAQIVIFPPDDALIGLYHIGIDIVNSIGLHKNSYQSTTAICVLFNPWNSYDDTFVPHAAQREEYLLNENGEIYTGTYDNVQSIPWKFHQFENDVLKSVLILLSTVGHLRDDDWGDATLVAKGISHIVSFPKGVLVPASGSTYDGGISPLEWNGSGQIFTKWLKGNGTVKYGSNFVFAGVIASALRTVGIGARIVTGFDIGYESDESFTINLLYANDFNTRKQLNTNGEACWSFCCWAEAYIRRPETGEKFSGWNALGVDTGPAPVLSIREGKIDTNYDTRKFYSDINSDVVLWKFFNEVTALTLLNRDTSMIGKSICTKSVKSPNRVEVTNEYKHKEASFKEREDMAESIRTKAMKFSNYIINNPNKELKFEVKNPRRVQFGEPISFSLNITNKSLLSFFEATITLQICSLLYTGEPLEDVKTKTKSLKLTRASTEEIKHVVTFDEYYPYLIDDCRFKCYASATIREPKSEFLEMHVFQVIPPSIDLRVEPAIPRKEFPTKITITYHNPTTIELEGELSVKEIDTENQISLGKHTVAPKSSIRSAVKINPGKSGIFCLHVKFEEKHVRSTSTIKVTVK